MTDYGRLMADRGEGDAFDRHVFAGVLAVAIQEGGPLTEALGLSPDALGDLVARYFPGARSVLLELVPPLDPDRAAIEEADLRQLLLDHRTADRPEEGWLAAIVARRSQRPHHLWQDLGLHCRQDLSRLLARHFAPLAALNATNMKWKKFFYRQLCEREGVLVCKAPHCAVCDDRGSCFGEEAGLALLQGAA
ncbi:MAG: nitrogen fixation protein NifQ [Magnetospirillum sp. WYHS-4]